MMRRLYTLLLALALPFASVAVLWRSLSEREYRRGWRERFGRGAPLPGTERSIWVHAVSVGEVQAAQPLLKALRQQWPERPMVVTSATPAGRIRALTLLAELGAKQSALASMGLGGKQSADPMLQARYAPYDLPGCVAAAIQRFRPALLLVLETELWPNLLHGCVRAGVPVLMVSARVSDRTSSRLRRFPSLLRPALAGGVRVAAQTAEDAARFRELGVPAQRVVVAGNLKFDRAPGASLRTTGAELRARWAPKRLMWVAGSTHAGEEQAAMWAHGRLLRELGDALLVVAPRHPARFKEVAQMLAGSGLGILKYSDFKQGKGDDPARCQVVLLDSIGDLEACYAGADIAFVGGSLVPQGGHSLLEPAALGVATVTGPHHDAAPAVAEGLVARGAVTLVENSFELSDEVLRLAQDQPARARMGATGAAVTAANRGALLRVLALLGIKSIQQAPAA
jgi:3-deoxy-D-manno-octulosonic-acid transferase